MNSKCGLLLVVFALAFGSQRAHAVDDPKYIAPPSVEMDINSVDLLSGRYEAELPELSVPAAPRLSFKFLQQYVVRVVATKYKGVPQFAREEPVDPSKPVDPEDPIEASLTGVQPTTYDFTYQGNTSERIKCDAGECMPERINTLLQPSSSPPEHSKLQYWLSD